MGFVWISLPVSWVVWLSKLRLCGPVYLRLCHTPEVYFRCPCSEGGTHVGQGPLAPHSWSSQTKGSVPLNGAQKVSCFLFYPIVELDILQVPGEK